MVGLGNPGPEYQATLHNLGFWVVERLAERAGVKVSRRAARALLGRGRLEETEVVLAKPQTFMNASGLAVQALLKHFKVTPAALIVIADDVALPWGMLRIREQGSSGGHKGLQSVIEALGTNAFVRVRLGIRPCLSGGEVEAAVADLTDYVLAPMSRGQRQQAAEMVEQATEAVRMILRDGSKRAMARFNRRVPSAP